MARNSLVFVLVTVALLVPAQSQGHIKILSPDGGESFKVGDVVTIEWCINIGHTLQNWDIWYSTDTVDPFTECDQQIGTWIGIVPNVPPTCTNGGSNFCVVPANPCCMQYFWTVPPDTGVHSGIISDTVKIRIRMDNAGTDYWDVSDNVFTITPATSGPFTASNYAFALEQNEPNPFRPRTSISFVLERDSPWVQLSIYDARGALVRNLLEAARPMGRHSFAWDGADEAGTRVTSGVYFYRLEANGRVATRKMTLLR
jgi:hypothetical protein